MGKTERGEGHVGRVSQCRTLVGPRRVVLFFACRAVTIVERARGVVS